ncbi:hypothetical protein GLYMA_12G012950v4 [Glycine max]|nr:hypothetical protein GLYMA_12G012950v4 [Glycine max]KAH1141063.1 hypothetical protein GYH30_032366 [Glycine max]
MFFFHVIFCSLPILLKLFFFFTSVRHEIIYQNTCENVDFFFPSELPCDKYGDRLDEFDVLANARACTELTIYIIFELYTKYIKYFLILFITQSSFYAFSNIKR